MAFLHGILLQAGYQSIIVKFWSQVVCKYVKKTYSFSQKGSHETIREIERYVQDSTLCATDYGLWRILVTTSVLCTHSRALVILIFDAPIEDFEVMEDWTKLMFE